MKTLSNIRRFPTPEPPPPPPRPVRARDEAFLLALGAALHRHGIPAHRLEATLTRVSARLGVRGQFFSTPTSLSASFGPAGHQRGAFARVEPGELHLDKLVRLDEVTDELLDGTLDVRAAAAEIERIEVEPPPYGPATTALATALTSAAVTPFFGGGWPEVVASGAVGLEVGLLALLATRVAAVARLYLLLAAAVAAASSAAAGWLWPGLAAPVVLLSGLIVLVPGMTLTVAANELATGHWVSGTARLTGAATVFLQIGLGVVLGGHARALLPVSASAPASAPLPDGAVWVAAVVAALCLLVLFRARWRDAPWILASALLALACARLGAGVMEPPAPAFLGGLGVGLFGNLYARLSRRPSLVPVVPGIMLLVPGSVGFVALQAMLQQDVVAGLETAFAAVLSAVALAAGLLVASAALPPRRDL